MIIRYVIHYFHFVHLVAVYIQCFQCLYISDRSQNQPCFGTCGSQMYDQACKICLSQPIENPVASLKSTSVPVYKAHFYLIPKVRVSVLKTQNQNTTSEEQVSQWMWRGLKLINLFYAQSLSLFCSFLLFLHLAFSCIIRT